MTNDELKAQWQRCEEWKDPDQWEILAVFYAGQGYMMNAKKCYERADECRMLAAVELVAVPV